MRKIVCYKFTLLLSIFILYGLLAPGDSIPSLSLPIPHLDKWIHISLFFCLTSVFCLEHFFIDHKKPQFRITLLIFSFFGLLTEILQGALTSSRMADPLDFIADIVGVLIAFIGFPITLRCFNYLINRIKGMNQSS